MQPWRNAASLILAASHGKQCLKQSSLSKFYDYNLLMLKRHRDSSLLPGNYVFPGGIIEHEDANLKWLSLFNKFGIQGNKLMEFVRPSKLPICQSTKDNELPRQISLRISAIRETFEECGILFCQTGNVIQPDGNWAKSLKLEMHELTTWQDRVHNNAEEFYKMCEILQCYPNLWALHEWSDWLTPVYLPNRVDTMFYMVCMSHLPETVIETGEIEVLKWDDPKNLRDEDRRLAPPQLYELTKISHFSSLEQLLKFAVDRNSVPKDVFFAVRVILSDGVVFLFPGDSEYPLNVNYSETELSDDKKTIEEYRMLAKVKNRLEFPKKKPRNLISDIIKNINNGNL